MLAALVSSIDGAQSLAEPKKVCKASKSKLEPSPKVSESKLSYDQQHVQELEFTSHTVDQLASKVN